MYVCSLIEAGASYIEVDFEAVQRLPKPSGSENYIFRLNVPEEYVVANALSFAYAVVPLKYHYIASELEIPAILEIETGDSDIMAILQLVSSSIDLSPFTMIRLVGDFEPDTISDILAKYKRRTVIPIDICPTNSTLSALTCAIAAVRANCDAVTVSFGEYEKFASLEELLIMLSAMYKIVVSPDYLAGICKASIFLSMFSEEKLSNLAMMVRRYMYRPINIQTVDDNRIIEQTVKPPPMSVYCDNRQKSNLAARVLHSMGIERELSSQIIEILDSCRVDIYGILKSIDDKEIQ
jgi:hypothetical protein